ncbi:hypothetical protein BS47DRAFT_984680 [Hydnum rufescens UP504]|uniref:Uncharacterized protein n=1 Tax=Hydnum rufescens UP504 TaxID=1448309 RepID=A0A9P6DTF7_9AGAM|nr:hypothetical protein BS47DRAFT_984680 [Hydnum rufescens UP504]
MSKRKFGSSLPSLYPAQSGDAVVSPEWNKRSKAMGAQTHDTHPPVSLLPQKPDQHSNYMILPRAPEGVAIPLAMPGEPSLHYTDGSDESFSTESVEFTSFESEPAGISFYPLSPDSLPLPPKPSFYSSSPAPRPSRIGRKARPRTEEGIFPLPASQKGVNGRTLVMENLPSTWTMALVTRLYTIRRLEAGIRGQTNLPLR